MKIQVPKSEWEDLIEEVKEAAAQCDKSRADSQWQGLEATLSKQARDMGIIMQRLQENDTEKDKVLLWVSDVPNQDDFEFVSIRFASCGGRNVRATYP